MISWFGHTDKRTRKYLIKTESTPSPNFISIIFLMWLILYVLQWLADYPILRIIIINFVRNYFYLPLYYTMGFININIISHELILYHGSDMWTSDRDKLLWFTIVLYYGIHQHQCYVTWTCIISWFGHVDK